MSKFRKAVRDAKKAAYAERKEKEGQSVVNWIFGILVFLGILYALFTIINFG